MNRPAIQTPTEHSKLNRVRETSAQITDSPLPDTHKRPPPSLHSTATLPEGVTTPHQDSMLSAFITPTQPFVPKKKKPFEREGTKVSRRSTRLSFSSSADRDTGVSTPTTSGSCRASPAAVKRHASSSRRIKVILSFTFNI